MIGLVLAAGAGRRLAPATDALPKALLDVGAGGVTGSILERTLANFAAVGIRDVAVVVGYRAEAIEAQRAALQRKHQVSIELIMNDRALEWNNAYSLWCAREWIGSHDTILANGDTLHPDSVERALQAAVSAHPTAGVLLALDTRKQLADEEMKVGADQGRVTRLHKGIEPAAAIGEYIGVSLIRSQAAPILATALHETFQRDPSLYYEDGYTQFIADGGRIETVDIEAAEWVEIDDHKDLARARELACRS